MTIMDGNDWLAGLLTSRTRAALLALLLRDDARPLGTRALARVSGCDYRSVWQELQRLEALGLVRSSREGRSRVWRRESSHPLLDRLQALVQAAEQLDRGRPAVGTVPAWLERLLRDLRGELTARYGDRFVGLWLYGSQARGDAGPDSDVDLLLRLDAVEDPTKEIDRISDLLADVNLRTGVLLSVMPVSDAQLRDAKGPFWEVVRHEGVAA